jgi:hypothetical protein
MFDSLKTQARRLSVGWYWPLVLLALSGCGLYTKGIEGDPPPHAFDPGLAPLTSAVMCDIPVHTDGPTCAPAGQEDNGVRIEDAAIDLAIGKKSEYALDFSNAAMVTCAGEPGRTQFKGNFPDGLPVCLNCDTQIGAGKPYADANAVCIAKCKDIYNFDTDSNTGFDVDSFCNANAHVSTNFQPNICFDGACSNGGTFDINFPDPRWNPESISWTDQTGTTSAGSTLTRSAATSNPPAFDAGAAASDQPITERSAYIDFEVGEANLGHVLGVSNCPGACGGVVTKPTDIDFGIVLFTDSHIYVVEHGVLVMGKPGQDAAGTFGPYDASQRFRIRVTDNLDTTVTVSYATVTLPCPVHTQCTENTFYSSGPQASFPLRVTALLWDQGASLTNVNIVRVHK